MQVIPDHTLKNAALSGLGSGPGMILWELC
jgi:hypothetical protein